MNISRTADLSLLQCPTCRGHLKRCDQQTLVCASGHAYPIVHGIPELLPPDVIDPLAVTGETKRQERQSHDEHALEHDATMPIDDRHVYSWLNYYQLFDMQAHLAAARPQQILVAMCGSGFEFELWAKLTPNVSGMDISTGLLTNAVRRADALGLTGQFVAGDIEHIPFADGAFDLVVVHHGLHHLASLRQAVTELLRVSRDRCLICEPIDSPMRRLFRRTGISPGVEPGGTKVCDISEAALQQIVVESGGRLTLAKRLFYPRARAPRPTRIHEWADRLKIAAALGPALAGFNRLFGRWLGTKGTFLITKQSAR
jgi:SAM-dependent methyltransferase/uncharacterized protein YbaR (Trm112 family)